MKIEINKRKLGLQLVFLILLVPTVLFVFTPILKPLVGRETARRIAKWERLQNDGVSLMKAGEYDEAVYDIVNFLYYVAEPTRTERYRLGVYVLLFLVVLFVLTSLLGREYAKEFH